MKFANLLIVNFISCELVSRALNTGRPPNERGRKSRPLFCLDPIASLFLQPLHGRLRVRLNFRVNVMSTPLFRYLQHESGSCQKNLPIILFLRLSSGEMSPEIRRKKLILCSSENVNRRISRL